MESELEQKLRDSKIEESSSNDITAIIHQQQNQHSLHSTRRQAKQSPPLAL